MRCFYGFFLIAAIALFVASGCISYSTLHTATPVEEGQTEGAVSGSFYGLSVDGDALAVPNTEVAVRYGVTEQSDIGFKVFPVGMAFDYNHALVLEEDFALSVNPYLSATHIGSSEGSVTYGVALANVLADVVRSDSATLTLGLKPGLVYALGSANDGDFESATGAVIGGMAGVRLDMSATMTVMPSIDIITPVEDLGAGWLYNVGLAFMF